jgi:hypothetical protein
MSAQGAPQAQATAAQTGSEALRAIPHSLSDVLEFSLRAPQSGTAADKARAAASAIASERGLAAVTEVSTQVGTQLGATPSLAVIRRQAPTSRDSIDATPGEGTKPDGWMTLLSGLIAMLFIAWRKLSR